jgi:4-hydroxy-tetrahydrodipicolinate synthase
LANVLGINLPERRFGSPIKDAMDAYSSFEGLFIPTVTPFTSELAVDLKSLDRLARFQAGIDGVAGLVSCARIGEGTVLRPEEKLEVHRAMGEAAHACGKRHIATIAPQSTAEAIEIVQKLESLPVDAVMIFPPLLFAWGKVGGDLKLRFFQDVTKATRLPIVLFQIPVQNYWYDVKTITAIAALPNIVAYKDASFSVELFTETCRQLQADRRKMRVLTGNDRFVGKSYELGAVGALIGISNIATDRWAALDAAGRKGDYARALALQEELKELSELVFGEPIVEAVARLKAILRDEGLIATAAVRPPQLGISEAERQTLLRSYRELRAAVA